MHTLPAFRRATAAAAFALSLAFAHYAAAETTTPPKDALGALNDSFRASYRELQEMDAATRGVVAGDMLLPTGGGAEHDA